MAWIIVIALVIVVVAGYFSIRKNFKNEIEQAAGKLGIANLNPDTADHEF